MLKLNLPGVHFLKIEMYKYINCENIILFSIITIIINYCLVSILLSLNFIFIFICYYKMFSYLILLSVTIIIQKLQITSFNEFVAYSGFLTSNLILLNYLI